MHSVCKIMFKGIAILMRYRETWKNIFVGVCCCVQPCKLAINNMVVMGLVLRKVQWFLSAIGILLLWKTISTLQECLVVYKHFDNSLHVRSSDSTCVHIFISVPRMVYQIEE